MRNTIEIMSEARILRPFESIRAKHSYLAIEVLCDMRDEQEAHNARMEQLAAGGIFSARSKKE